MQRNLSIVVVLTVIALTTVSCGSSNAICGPVVRDALDPGSATHVLPGAPTPSYLVNPPTSGAHQPGPRIQGPVRNPIAPELQVGVLEEGRVLIQYRGLTSQEVTELESLNSTNALVARAASLPGDAKVVATAWVTHQKCRGLDLKSMREFSKDHANKGPTQP